MQEACVECEDYFDDVSEVFDIHYSEKDPITKKKTHWTEQELRHVVYCKNFEDFEKYVREQRGIDPDEKLLKKWQLDGGGDHFKICVNLIQESLLPKNAKKIKQRNLDSSVKATFMVLCVEKIPETRENVLKCWNLLDIGPISGNEFVASDLKLYNLLVGIQGHTSTYPCPLCEWKKSDGIICNARPRFFGTQR